MSGERGNAGLLAGISEKLIGTLPPAMLLLVLLNIVFIGIALYMFSHNTEARNEMLSRIIESCLNRQPLK